MRIQASEIASRLAATTEQVASMLLPSGKRDGSYWVAGDAYGSSGKSLRVYLNGQKAGKWADYAGDEHGDLLDLWAVSRCGGNISEAMRDAADWLGIRPDPVREPKRTHTKPKPQLSSLTDAHRSWLRGRGIADETMQAFGLKSKGDFIAFPSTLDGDLARVKYRTPDKRFSQEKDCVHCLFGWQAIDPKARQVAIVEGELDAMALHQYGMPTLSVPNGGGRKQGHWIEVEYDRLSRFDTIFLVLDDDDEGQAASAEILERLGEERCRIVQLPCKDANDCLMAEVSKDVMRDCFRDAKCVDPDELKRPHDFFHELHGEFFGEPDNQSGFGTPFPAIRDELRFRPGELVILAGKNGTGKSQFAGHLMLEAMRDEFRVCVASMEMKPARYLKRLARQTGATDTPTEQYLVAIDRWWNDKMWIFNLVGTAKRDRMLDVFLHARRRYNVRVFLIDNLAKCGIAEDDYNGQKAFVDELGDFAKSTDSVVILVHHMAKHGEGKEGVKGTGAITDMADTVLLIWRNKVREEKLRENPDDLAALDEPSGTIRCEKQRNGESEPVKGFWFDAKSFQFLSTRKSHPHQYVGWTPARENVA